MPDFKIKTCWSNLIFIDLKVMLIFSLAGASLGFMGSAEPAKFWDLLNGTCFMMDSVVSNGTHRSKLLQRPLLSKLTLKYWRSCKDYEGIDIDLKGSNLTFIHIIDFLTHLHFTVEICNPCKVLSVKDDNCMLKSIFMVFGK